MEINVCCPAPIDSLFVHNDSSDPAVLSYLVTESKGWLCLPVAAGIDEFYAGQTLALGATFCMADTTQTGTMSSSTLRVRHQSAIDGPTLTINAEDLGTWSFSGLENTSHPEIDVEQNQLLRFSWGGEGEYYRFGWDVVDPYDSSDQGWAVTFQTSYYSSSKRFPEGYHTITVQTMDGDAFSSMGYVGIRVVPIPPEGASGGTIEAQIRDCPHAEVTGEPSFSECTFSILAVAPLIGYADLASPGWLNATAGVATTGIYGMVGLDCVTNLPGATSGVLAEVGYGPDGSDPSVSPVGWRWLSASFIYDTGYNDMYLAWLSVATAGTYDYCYRYAYGAGPWVYGDLDGSTNGYSVDQAGSLIVTDPTGVPLIPAVVRLYPNQPNPFNPRTTIRFDLPVAGQAQLSIYDLAGRLVRVLVEGERAAGSYEAVWDGRDATGHSAPSGSYLARLVAGGKVEGVRLSLVR
jgi:hypothetical protein